MADVDWLAVKTEYITTDISLRKLADKHGISRTTIGHRSKVEGWVEARQRHKDSVVSKTANKIANQKSKDLAKLIQIADMQVDVLEKAYSDPEQFFRHLVETRDSKGKQDVVERVYKKMDTKAMKDCASILRDLTAVHRDLHDLPTLAQKESQKIASERLKLEKKKAESANQTSKSVEVVFSNGDVNEWSG